MVTKYTCTCPITKKGKTKYTCICPIAKKGKILIQTGRTCHFVGFVMYSHMIVFFAGLLHAIIYVHARARLRGRAFKRKLI